jgi:hypothetical protein
MPEGNFWKKEPIVSGSIVAASDENGKRVGRRVVGKVGSGCVCVRRKARQLPS